MLKSMLWRQNGLRVYSELYVKIQKVQTLYTNNVQDSQDIDGEVTTNLQAIYFFCNRYMV